MLRMIGGLCALMTIAANPLTAVAAAPLKPTSKWIVDFDDAQCIASRNYGSVERPLFLTFKEPVVGNSLQIAVVKSAGAATPPPVEKPVKLAFDDAEPLKIGVLAATVKKTKQRLFRMNLTADQVARLRNAKTLTFSAGGELEETFVVDEVAALLNVMKECVVDLRKAWNADGGTGKLRSARGNIQAVFKPEDYPADAMFDDAHGTAKFVILIDEAGKVADCTIVETSGVASLDAQSCGIILTRGKFQPAVGSDGKPARDFWTQRVTWKVEGR